MKDLPTAITMSDKLLQPIKEKHGHLTSLQMGLVEHLVRTGCTQAAASRDLGIDDAHISKTLRLPHVLAYLNDLSQVFMVTLGTRALHRASELLDSMDHRVGAMLAIDLMNRAGLGKDTAHKGVQVGIKINV